MVLMTMIMMSMMKMMTMTTTMMMLMIIIKWQVKILNQTMIKDVFTCCGQHTSAGGRFIQRARVQRGVWGVVHPGLHVQNGTGLK